MNKKVLYQIILLLLLGAIVRLVYGIIYQPWTQSPDQIAMEILIKNGTWSYGHLIHYPHEGGTILMAILGRTIAFFTSFNSLVIVAFLLDLISRFVQLVVVRKIANDTIFWIFGCWTIFAVPMLIPWATLNFGLHAISAIFPFLLIYILTLHKESKKYFILLGAFIGIAIWFSYDNVVLLVPFLILPLIEKVAWKNWMMGCFSFLGILFIHFLVRFNFDFGFDLNGLSLGSIRGESFQLSNPEIYHRLYKVWTNPLAESAVVLQNSPYVFFWFKYVWITLTGLGVIGLIIKRKVFKNNPYLLYSTSIIITFVLIYAISPFYYDKDVFGHYVNYRHFTYVLPLLAFITIWGLSQLRLKAIFSTLYLVLSVYLGVVLFTVKPTDGRADMAAGWVLVQKFGSHPHELQRIISNAAYDQTELTKGVGWGLTFMLFNQVSHDNEEAVNNQIQLLDKWMDDYKVADRGAFIEGVEFAFAPYISPVLDADLLPIILIHIQTEKKAAH